MNVVDANSMLSEGTNERAERREATVSSVLPLVTLVMPSYNEEAHIEVCLRSLLGQDYPADRMEVLVADGGSADRTREIVAKLGATDPRVG